VAGIEETYYASAVVFPGSRVVRLASDRWEKGMSGSFSQTVEFDGKICEMLARDVSFVLDQLQALNEGSLSNPVARRLDLGHVIVIGHSIGGRGAALAYQSDPRIRACISLDGFSPALDAGGNFGGTSVPRPFLLLRPAFPMPSKDVLAQARMTERGFRDWSERSLAARKSFYQHGCQGSWEVAFDVPGASHAAFTDLPLLSANRDPGTVAQRERSMTIVRAYALAFLDRIVGRGGGGLLDGASPEFPEVDVQRFVPVAP